MIQGRGQDEDGDAEAVRQADFDAAYEAVRGTPGYQFAPSEPPPPPRQGWFSRWLDGVFSSDAAGAVLTVIGWILKIVFWAGVAAGAALLLWLVGRAVYEAVRHRRGRPAPEAPAPYRPAPSTVRTLLEDAAKLAAEGRYGEAVRLILRRSVEDMERQRPGMVRDAMTSREIAVLPILTEAAQGAFARIAALTERAAFAGRALTRAEYEEARGIYERLTKTLIKGSPA